MNVDILYSSSKKLKITKIYNNDSSVLLEIMRDFEFIYSNLIEDGITSWKKFLFWDILIRVLGLFEKELKEYFNIIICFKNLIDRILKIISTSNIIGIFNVTSNFEVIKNAINIK